MTIVISLYDLSWVATIFLFIFLYLVIGFFVEKKLSGYINKFIDLFFKEKDV